MTVATRDQAWLTESSRVGLGRREDRVRRLVLELVSSSALTLVKTAPPSQISPRTLTTRLLHSTHSLPAMSNRPRQSVYPQPPSTTYWSILDSCAQSLHATSSSVRPLHPPDLSQSVNERDGRGIDAFSHVY